MPALNSFICAYLLLVLRLTFSRTSIIRICAQYNTYTFTVHHTHVVIFSDFIPLQFCNFFLCTQI